MKLLNIIILATSIPIAYISTTNGLKSTNNEQKIRLRQLIQDLEQKRQNHKRKLFQFMKDSEALEQQVKNEDPTIHQEALTRLGFGDKKKFSSSDNQKLLKEYEVIKTEKQGMGAAADGGMGAAAAGGMGAAAAGGMGAAAAGGMGATAAGGMEQPSNVNDPFFPTQQDLALAGQNNFQQYQPMNNQNGFQNSQMMNNQGGNFNTNPNYMGNNNQQIMNNQQMDNQVGNFNAAPNMNQMNNMGTDFNYNNNQPMGNQMMYNQGGNFNANQMNNQFNPTM